MEKVHHYAIYSDESKGEAIHFCVDEEEAIQFVTARNNAQAFGFPDERVDYFYKSIDLQEAEVALIHDFLLKTPLLNQYLGNTENTRQKANEILKIIKN